MKLGIPVYEGVNLLDVAGPYEMFNWVPPKGPEDRGRLCRRMSGHDVERPPLRCARELRRDPGLDVLSVPGGDPAALGTIMSDPDSPYLAYLCHVAAGAKWVCSACEGALLLARAGLLDGHKATRTGRSYQCLAGSSRDRRPHDPPAFRGVRQSADGRGNILRLDEALKLMAPVRRQDRRGSAGDHAVFPQAAGLRHIPRVAPACPVTPDRRAASDAIVD